MACLHGWHAGVGDVADMLAWVEWMASVRGWPASVGGVVGVIAWVTC